MAQHSKQVILGSNNRRVKHVAAPQLQICIEALRVDATDTHDAWCHRFKFIFSNRSVHTLIRVVPHSLLYVVRIITQRSSAYYLLSCVFLQSAARQSSRHIFLFVGAESYRWELSCDSQAFPLTVQFGDALHSRVDNATVLIWSSMKLNRQMNLL